MRKSISAILGCSLLRVGTGGRLGSLGDDEGLRSLEGEGEGLCPEGEEALCFFCLSAWSAGGSGGTGEACDLDRLVPPPEWCERCPLSMADS